MNLNLNKWCQNHQLYYKYYQIEETNNNTTNIKFNCEECLNDEIIDNYPELLTSDNFDNLKEKYINENELEELNLSF